MPEKKFKQILTNEKNLVRILDNLKEGIIAHDLNRRIFFFNREAERITGYSRSEVLNTDCHEAFGEPFCGERCLFRDGSTFVPNKSEYPVTLVTKDGETRNVEMSVSKMRDEGGEVFGVIAFIKDITDIVQFRLRTGELTGYSNIVGRDRKMLQVYQQIRDLAGYDYPVHIFGETGTGKELVAEAIHAASRRGGAPFVPINCGALPEGLIESELFGHVKGAFTGAIRDKKGRFELADSGTILLDEVAELSKEMQVKLLRFLQTGKFEKVGGEQTVSVNVRIISATNSDLKKEVKNKNFREDLYYRLNVIPIHLPPLRERNNDIPLLVEYFLKQFSGDGGDKKIVISSEAISLMIDYAWPGNVRQLQNALQYAIVKSSGNFIRPEDLPMELFELRINKHRRGPSKKLDFESVQAALEKSGHNKAKAARLLGVGRATLYRFLNDYPDVVPESIEKI
ncbi:MAG: sigma 54-interacting transcriptional regulator [Desulfobacteraceae bacterium]|nr:sigma 54-interacting transcriptional regulator [Desulfobacteraceae bacterium]MBC2756329.1 sigma 54-interacting transcriptional regulator [Desulfobacteraceae bacterium]